MDITEAIKTRFSTRAFLDKPIKKEIIYEILDIARFAPSSHNTQPWDVRVVTENTKNILIKRLISDFDNKKDRKYDYIYGSKTVPPFIKERRQACNIAVFTHKNINPKKDIEKLNEHIKENFRFFNAPVVFIFTTERGLGEEVFIDLGIFAQTIMLSALNYGIHTCAQTSPAAYADTIRDVLKLPQNKIIVFTMSLGYPDLKSHINKLRMDRIGVSEFTTFYE